MRNMLTPEGTDKQHHSVLSFTKGPMRRKPEAGEDRESANDFMDESVFVALHLSERAREREAVTGADRPEPPPWE